MRDEHRLVASHVPQTWGWTHNLSCTGRLSNQLSHTSQGDPVTYFYSASFFLIYNASFTSGIFIGLSDLLNSRKKTHNYWFSTFILLKRNHLHQFPSKHKFNSTLQVGTCIYFFFLFTTTSKLLNELIFYLRAIYKYISKFPRMLDMFAFLLFYWFLVQLHLYYFNALKFLRLVFWVSIWKWFFILRVEMKIIQWLICRCLVQSSLGQIVKFVDPIILIFVAL